MAYIREVPSPTGYLSYLLKAKSAHGIHSPFVYRFIHELLESGNDDYYQFKELNITRERLLRDATEIIVNDFGAGSRIFKDNRRKVCDIAKHGISSQKFSELYFKLVNFCHANTIIELGTSLGLNTLYFARANSKARIYTIEGCHELAVFAGELSRKENAENITVINDTFENALPALLDKIPSADIFYVDGNHRYQPTMDYFSMALPKKNNNSVFIFDDINWNADMQKAWKEIKSHPEVTLSIDLFYAGFIFFRSEQKQKEHFVLRY